MRLPLPISLSLLLFFSWTAARAQLLPADDFFHAGAQFYISNNIPSALEQVEAGLKLYPDDEKLKKLDQLLKQQQQQQSQQNQQQDKQQQQKDQKNQDQQNKSQQDQKDQQSQQQKSDDQKNKQQPQPSPKDSQDQKKADEQKQNQPGEKKDEQKKEAEPQKSPGEKKDGEKKDDQDATGQPVAPGQMTPEEAKRLLDAQKGSEQVLKWQPKGKPQDAKRPVKDW